MLLLPRLNVDGIPACSLVCDFKYSYNRILVFAVQSGWGQGEGDGEGLGEEEGGGGGRG